MTSNRAATTVRTPRAAAIAGLIFSLLLITAFILLRSAVPLDPRDSGDWLRTHFGSIKLGLNLIPFAGIAFLWFIGVLRNRLGEREDRFFATVFLGGGLLFLGLLCVFGAIVGGMLGAFVAKPDMIGSAGFHIARAASYEIFNTYMLKAAVVFMVSASTAVLRASIAPRWLALAGYGLSLLLLAGSYVLPWSFLIFPIWVGLISGHILIDSIGASQSERLMPSEKKPQRAGRVAAASWTSLSEGER